MLTNLAAPCRSQHVGAHARWSRHHENRSGTAAFYHLQSRQIYHSYGVCWKSQHSECNLKSTSKTACSPLPLSISTFCYIHLCISMGLKCVTWRGARIGFCSSWSKHKRVVCPVQPFLSHFSPSTDLSVHLFYEACSLWSLILYLLVFLLTLYPTILTSTQFPSTSWKRTQKGSDLEATSLSSRLAAVTDSSTRVTQCWGPTLRFWLSAVEPKV